MPGDDLVKRRAQSAERKAQADRKSSVPAPGPKSVSVATVKRALAAMDRRHYDEMRAYEDAVKARLDTAGRALFDEHYGRDFAMRDLVEPPGFLPKTGSR